MSEKIGSAIDEEFPSQGLGAVSVAPYYLLRGPERLDRPRDGVLILVLITGQLEFQNLLYIYPWSKNASTNRRSEFQNGQDTSCRAAAIDQGTTGYTLD